MDRKIYKRGYKNGERGYFQLTMKDKAGKGDLETKLKAFQIVAQCGMSTMPEYYSGRGARLDDLDGQMLEGIYQAIEQNHGKNAANNYAQMVADIPVLSATDFILTLYALEANEWEWDKSLLGNQNGIYAGDDDSAFGTLCSALSGMRETDQTAIIRREFLLRHGIKIPEPWVVHCGQYGECIRIIER